MPTGKYKGYRMEEIPAHYLLWIFDNRRWGRRRDLLIYIMEREKDLRKEVKREQSNIEFINGLMAEASRQEAEGNE